MNLAFSPSLLGADISVGDHLTHKIFGLTVDLDTVWATGVAALIVIALGLSLRRQITSGVPGKLQAAWELMNDAVTKQVQDSIGPRGVSIIPLAMALFVFILVCNFLDLLGLGSKYEFLGAPTGDINLPLAMSFFVIVLVHIYSIKVHGPTGYVKRYISHPFPIILAPINLFFTVIEEIAKPLTLALRLFGNLLSGGLMLTLIAALGAWKIASLPLGDIFVPIIDIIWKLFDGVFIGSIQAFIFALLTILYFDQAMTIEHHDDHGHTGAVELVPNEPLPNEPVVQGSSI